MNIFYENIDKLVFLFKTILKLVNSLEKVVKTLNKK